MIKNIITIAVLVFLYRNTEVNEQNRCSKLSIQFLSILLLMFALLPVQMVGINKRVSSFSEYEVSFRINIFISIKLPASRGF